MKKKPIQLKKTPNRELQTVAERREAFSKMSPAEIMEHIRITGAMRIELTEDKHFAPIAKVVMELCEEKEDIFNTDQETKSITELRDKTTETKKPKK